MTFKQDRLENEKNDPQEASSLKFIYVPIVLISIFIGFGVSFLALKTPNTSMAVGDSRTTSQEPLLTEGNAKESLESLMEKGKMIYTTSCQACHQANGAGIPGTFPPLIASEWVLESPKRMVAIVLHGIQGEITVQGQKYNNLMPPFKDQLKPGDIAAVTTYIRNSFGNKADLISSELASQVQEETKARATSWGGEAELKTQTWD